MDTELIGNFSPDPFLFQNKKIRLTSLENDVVP